MQKNIGKKLTVIIETIGGSLETLGYSQVDADL